MVFCCITNCRNSSKSCNYMNKGITFHRFPKDPEMRDKWIGVTGRSNWFPSDYSRVCSVHFEEEQFDPTTQRRTLIKSATPSVNIWKLISSTDKKPSTSSLKRKLNPTDSTDEEQSDGGSEFSTDNQQGMGSLSVAVEPSADDENLSIITTEYAEPDTRETKKLITEVKKSRVMIATQRLKIKSLQAKVRRYRKKILQLQELAKAPEDRIQGEYVFFRHFLDPGDD